MKEERGHFPRAWVSSLVIQYQVVNTQKQQKSDSEGCVYVTVEIKEEKWKQYT